LFKNRVIIVKQSFNNRSIIF